MVQVKENRGIDLMGGHGLGHLSLKFGPVAAQGAGSGTHLELHFQEWRQPEQRTVLAAQAS